MEQVQLALRDQICRMGVSPELTADVLDAFAAQNRARDRRRALYQQRSDAARQAVPLSDTAVALRDVPMQVAPFCHDVLLYRAFIGPAYQDSAKEWMGPQMWQLVSALGGWRRVHTLPLSRMVNEALVAREQTPSFLRPPAHSLVALGMHDLWAMTRPWVHKYPPLSRVDIASLAHCSMSAGAWLWVFDRSDADMRRRGGPPDDDLPTRVARLAGRVDEAVGLTRERA